MLLVLKQTIIYESYRSSNEAIAGLRKKLKAKDGNNSSFLLFLQLRCTRKSEVLAQNSFQKFLIKDRL